METSPLYTPEKPKEHLHLSEGQKDAIRAITLGIEEVDEAVREMAVEDVIHTLENGHPLNRIIPDQEGGTTGYIACEDFIPHEAYIKYFGTSGQTGRNLLKEIPAFLEYAESLGYGKLNFHGWNERLNCILTRYGFERLRTDKMADIAVDFYEKTLGEQKSSENVEKERIAAFEQKYMYKLSQEYEQTLATFSQDVRPEKERIIAETFRTLSDRLSSVEGIDFADRQKTVLKLKLARYFQNNYVCDLNTLYDAVIETPKFINTDKGSFHRLLEVHEEKTLQKVAEMRKRRAEMGDTEAFNPYENLFTTKSGDYYLARLLNMPHLEEESEYMSHCVGTSDSYINKMKRGDVEILSFRSIATNEPIITIEYNLKTKVIEQMKKADDEYLNRNDPYFYDVIDALKQLRTTKTDTGELRDFTKISPSEFGNIEVKDDYILTERGEVHFRDFNPKQNDFILKIGAFEVTVETPKEDTAKWLQIVEGAEVSADQIAYKPDEISEHTKAYIGPLELGIFDVLPHTLDHVYTAFPEGRVKFRTIELGTGIKDGPEFQKAIETQGMKVYGWAADILKSPNFKVVGERGDADLVEVSVAGLGFNKITRYDAICARAEELGLELCPPEVGPQLRLQYADQPNGEYLSIAMKAINNDSGGDPNVFHVNRAGDELWLHTDGGRPGSEWNPGGRFVFLRPRK